MNFLKNIAEKAKSVADSPTRSLGLGDEPGPGGLPDVPLHLKTGGGKVGAELGWGVGYSHDLDRVRSVQYMPRGLENTKFL